jgi:predicted acylesterase/phospholipase RssA
MDTPDDAYESTGARMTFADKLKPAPQKRLLALDGGGIRGLITIEVLGAIEETLRARYPREHWAGSDFRLSDYFDYVAGTSTGAIIATCISLGMSVAEIRGFYRANGTAMFDKASLLRRFSYKFEDDALAATLQRVFGSYLPDDERAGHDGGPRHLTLGSAALRTLLLVVMRNATTDSPWPVSNNPRAKYNDRALPGCNLDIPLWQLVRASTAAPTYFPPEELVLDGHRFLFVDGGVTPYNNPAFLVFLMSTVGAYRLDWDTGADRMLLVSVGTGINPNANRTLAPGDMNLIYNAGTIPSALMLASLNEQDMLCRVFGRCRHGATLDSEVESLVLSADEERRAKLPKLFTYMRYNAELTREGLDALGLGDIHPPHVQQLDSIAHMDDLARVGQAIARTSVTSSHFDGFVP